MWMVVIYELCNVLRGCPYEYQTATEFPRTFFPSIHLNAWIVQIFCVARWRGSFVCSGHAFPVNFSGLFPFRTKSSKLSGAT